MNHSLVYICEKERISVSIFSNCESTLTINISITIHECQESKKIRISLYLDKIHDLVKKKNKDKSSWA